MTKALLRMDNISAVTYYVNKLGGTVSLTLTAIVKDLWLWCLQRDISLIAEHLLGVQNTVVDEELQVMKDRTDWKLNLEVFSQINRRLDPLAVDLFTSRFTTQLPQFFTWRLDPEAEALNAFSQQWDKPGGEGICQSPTEPGGKTLSQVRAQRATIVLVAPVWKTGMVPHSPGNVDRLSCGAQRSRQADTADNTNSGTGDGTPTSCVAYLRQHYENKHISDMGTELLLASWRAKSSKSYDSLFGKWVCWCHQRDADWSSDTVFKKFHKRY